MGVSAREWAVVQEAVGVLDASARDRLLLVGDSRIEFVQGLATNDLETLPVGSACEAAFITPKGKLVADARIVKLEDSLLVDLAPGRGAALVEHFGKYLLNESFEAQDVKEALAELQAWGPKAGELLGIPTLTENTTGVASVGGHEFMVVGTAFGAAAFVPVDAKADVLAALVSKAESIGGGAVSADAAELRRIALGLGEFGRDWDEATNPLEAGLDRMLHYKKGCYVGQEVVAKATYIGRVSRRLVRLSWTGPAAPANTELTGGKTPGRITSSATAPDGTTLALGVVRHDQTKPGTILRLGADGPPVTVLGYPYLSKDKPV